MEDTTKNPAPQHPAHDHEKTDVSVAPVAKFAFGIAAGTLVVMFAMVGLFGLFQADEAKGSPKPPLMAAQNPAQEPPEPRLQPRPPIELKQLRDDEHVVMSQYKWLDPDRQIVRIPVSRAMELIAKEGVK